VLLRTSSLPGHSNIEYPGTGAASSANLFFLPQPILTLLLKEGCCNDLVYGVLRSKRTYTEND